MKIFSTILFIVFSYAAIATEGYELSGTYSDFVCNNSQGGVVGTEITFLRAMGSDDYKTYAIVQFSEGVPKKPELVEVTFDSGYVIFNVNYMGYFNTEFKGVETAGTLQGEFSKPLDVSIKLSKTVSYWHVNDGLCGGYN